MDEIITTNEPDRIYCNLSHEELRAGSKRIVWSAAVKNLMYQFCASYGVSEHCLGDGKTMVTMLQYIGFDTKDEEVIRNAVTKVCTWIIGHINNKELMGAGEEQSSAPRQRMAPWRNRFSVFAKSWASTKYDVVNNGLAPNGADLTMGEWQNYVWRSKDICIEQTVAWKKANPDAVMTVYGGSAASVLPAPAPAVSAPTMSTNSVTPPPTTRTVEVEKVVEVEKRVPSRLHQFLVRKMTEMYEDVTEEQMDQWLDTADGMQRVEEHLVSGIENTDADLEATIQDLRSTSADLEATVQDLRSKNQKLQQRAEKALEDYNKLQKELEERRNSEAARYRENQDLIRQVQDLEAELAAEARNSVLYHANDEVHGLPTPEQSRSPEPLPPQTPRKKKVQFRAVSPDPTPSIASNSDDGLSSFAAITSQLKAPKLKKVSRKTAGPSTLSSGDAKLAAAGITID